jgi:UDP-N-acetylglucosamine kinase
MEKGVIPSCYTFGMDFTEEEQRIQEQAKKFIDDHRDELVERLILSKRPLRLPVVTIFMAGSPGAGKTEFSRRYMPSALDKDDRKLVGSLRKRGVDIESVESLFVRIDVDDVRDFLPPDLYHKTDEKSGVHGNAHVVQSAANHGLDILRKYCFENDISFIHDGTFSNYDTMRALIKKSLKQGRDVHIFYIYLDPLAAWEFTRARECLEGRNIRKEKFIEQFFASRKNVDLAKKEFGRDIKITFVLKDADTHVRESEFNVSSVDKFLKMQYDKGSIREYSEDDLQRLIV